VSFDKLLAKVEQAEDALEARERQVAADLRVLGSTWREAVTPTRIVIAGVIAGFLAGRARPMHAAGAIGGSLGNTRWLQLASSVAGLVGALQAKFAAEGAEVAAKDAEAAADGVPPAARDVPPADDGPQGRPTRPLPPSERPRRAEPAWDVPPVAAEAATELSEKR
jgi:hypothetical protein